MDFSDEKILEVVDRSLQPLERDFSRAATIVAEGDITRVDLPPTGTRTCIRFATIIILAMIVPAALAALTSDLPAGDIVKGVLPFGVVAAVFLAVSGLLTLSRQSIVISPIDVALHYSIGPFHRSRRVPISAIRDVRTEAFSFANWDPHVAIVTDRGVRRVAWTVSPDIAHQIADAIRKYSRSATGVDNTALSP